MNVGVLFPEVKLQSRALPLSLLARAAFNRRNPRTVEQMRSIAIEKGLERVVSVAEALEIRASGTKFYLLWPDANGIDRFATEFALFFKKPQGSEIWVLNGRRRAFRLTLRTWTGFLMRRFLEKFWVGEALFTIVFFIVTPFLLLEDLMKKESHG